MGRKIGAVVAGVAVLGVVVFALRWAGGLIHPLPPGVDPMNPDDQAAFTAHLATMPFAAWGLAWGSEILGAFLGALTAGRIADSKKKWFPAGMGPVGRSRECQQLGRLPLPCVVHCRAAGRISFRLLGRHEVSPPHQSLRRRLNE